MDFVLIHLTLLSSFLLVQSNETITVSKSIKINEKMIYDCVDIYKQPSLNHPLLKNHKIQMEPSFAISKSKNKVERKRYGNMISCPNGTVPILRNTKEYFANAQYMAEKHFNPLTAESHGTHLAGARMHYGRFAPYHGIGAVMSVHDLNVSRDQISYAHVWVGKRVNNEDNYIQTGWMINPTLFGDGRPWTYAFWKGANGACCYNTLCPGFIQVLPNVPLSEPLQRKLLYENIKVAIEQDNESGNWWRTNMEKIGIGYWPKELFDLIGNDADMVGVGGAVESSPSGNSPPMGNGHFPTKSVLSSAHIQEIRYIAFDNSFIEGDVTKMEKMLDSEKCYGIISGEHNMLFFGGPGGDSCGI